MEDKIKKGEVISLSRTRNIEASLDFKKAEKLDNNGKSKGKTIYFGNKNSLMMIRFYDKKREQQAKKIFCPFDFWQRYEIVLKREKAIDFVEKLRSGENFSDLYLKVMSGLIRFVEPSDDKNKARWKTSPFWDDFIKGSAPIKLESKNLYPSILKTISWVDQSVIGSLQLLVEIAKMGDFDLLELLKNSQSRERSDRQKTILGEFDLLSEKQKQYLNDYYFNDFSLTEISENYDISKQAVSNNIKRTITELEQYEEKLNLIKLNNERLFLLNELRKSTSDEGILSYVDQLIKLEN